MLVIEAPEVVLDGEIWVRPKVGGFNSSRPAGAGGSLRIYANTLRGSGLINVSGRGTGTNFTLGHFVGPGGGGRAALYVDTFDGFDPNTQVRAHGGRRDTDNLWAGPGTIYVRTATATYGQLIVDNGEEADGTPTGLGPSAPLPDLGSGLVTSVGAAQADAWCGSRSDAAAQVAGSLDAARRQRRSGARDLPGVGHRCRRPRIARRCRDRGWKQRRCQLRRGNIVSTGLTCGTVAGLVPRIRSSSMFSKQTATSASRRAWTLAIWWSMPAPSCGPPTAIPRICGSRALCKLLLAVCSTCPGSAMLGGRAGHVNGDAPAWVTPSSPDAGGSHGGRGRRWDGPGPAGDVYDSVYVPSLNGAGGGRDEDGSGDGTRGGGVLILEVGTLELDGAIRARSATSGTNSSRPAGAGGSVQLFAGTVRGTGRIDLSGSGTNTNVTLGSFVGPGGGGRAALYVDVFDGFDPATQVWVRGGRRDTNNTWADAGTIYVRQPADTYGRLIVDNGAGRGAGTTDLPALGRWTVVSTEVDGDDLWVTVTEPLLPRWLGNLARAAGFGRQRAGGFRGHRSGRHRPRASGRGGNGGRHCRARGHLPLRRHRPPERISGDHHRSAGRALSYSTGDRSM